MRLARVVHEEADLLNSIRQVRTSQREVLEGADQTPVVGAVRGGERGAVGRRELGVSVNRSRCRVTLSHAGALEKVDGVLALRQEEAIGRAADGDAEEVM
jgi:hypothetical protein